MLAIPYGFSLSISKPKRGNTMAITGRKSTGSALNLSSFIFPQAPTTLLAKRPHTSSGIAIASLSGFECGKDGFLGQQLVSSWTRSTAPPGGTFTWTS